MRGGVKADSMEPRWRSNAAGLSRFFIESTGVQSRICKQTSGGDKSRERPALWISLSVPAEAGFLRRLQTQNILHVVQAVTRIARQLRNKFAGPETALCIGHSA